MYQIESKKMSMKDIGLGTEEITIISSHIQVKPDI